jgi:hypothetical protein
VNIAGLENRDYGRGVPPRWPRNTPYIKLALTSPTSGGRSVGVVRSWPKAIELPLVIKRPQRHDTPSCHRTTEDIGKEESKTTLRPNWKEQSRRGFQYEDTKAYKRINCLSKLRSTRISAVSNIYKLHGLSPPANYTDRATAACRRNDCQLSYIAVAIGNKILDLLEQLNIRTPPYATNISAYFILRWGWPLIRAETCSVESAQ